MVKVVWEVPGHFPNLAVPDQSRLAPEAARLHRAESVADLELPAAGPDAQQTRHLEIEGGAGSVRARAAFFVEPSVGVGGDEGVIGPSKKESFVEKRVKVGLSEP